MTFILGTSQLRNELLWYQPDIGSNWVGESVSSDSWTEESGSVDNWADITRPADNWSKQT